GNHAPFSLQTTGAETLTKPKRARHLAEVQPNQAHNLGAQAPIIGTPGAQTPAMDESRFRSRIERRPKKVRLPEQKLTLWENWCLVYKMDFQDLVETSIDFFMAQFEASASSGAQVPTFNINDRSNDDEVLNLDLPLLDQNSGSPGAQNIPIEELKARRALEFYSAKTGNPIRPRDRQAFETGHDEFPGVMNMPPHVIRYGIMASILICKSKVNSFSYCLGQIHAAAEAGISP